MNAATHTPRQSPVRTCAGCRATAPQAELIRFAVSDAPPYLAPDLGRRMPGRGVWLGASRRCLEQASRGGFARSLKRKINVEVDTLIDQIEMQQKRRAQGLLLAASRTRSIAIGTDAVREMLNSASLLWVAEDAQNRRDQLTAMAERLGRRCVVYGTKAWLGHTLGRDEVAVVAMHRAGAGIATEVAALVSQVALLKGSTTTCRRTSTNG